MSEASAYQALRGHLATLRLAAAAEALPGLLDQAKAGHWSTTVLLERLFSTEVAASDARRQATLARFACLPAPWRISDFDFDAQPSVDKKLVAELETLRFLDDGRCHKAALEGRWATMMRFYAAPRFLVIDELGYLPLPEEAAAALFQVVTQRYLRASTCITTNLGIASWAKVTGDPVVAAAMLDRLLHRSVVLNIDGPSYRLRAHRARAEASRKAVASGK